jgi:hypothetical protein
MQEGRDEIVGKDNDAGFVRSIALLSHSTIQARPLILV